MIKTIYINQRKNVKRGFLFTAEYSLPIPITYIHVDKF